MFVLRKDIAGQTVKIGPFLDGTDGVTEEIGLATALSAAGGIKIAYNGGAFVNLTGPPTVTHDTLGWYEFTMDILDLNIAGNMTMIAHDSTTHLPVWHQFRVLDNLTYNALFSNVTTNLAFNANGRIDVGEWLGTPVTEATPGVPDVNTIRINNDAAAAANLAFSALGIIASTFKTGTHSQTVHDTNLTIGEDDIYGKSLLVITSGAWAGFRGAIEFYDATTNVGRITLKASDQLPSATPVVANGDTFVIV